MDFGIEIYTAPTGTESDDSSWYGKRLSSEPMYSNNIKAPAKQWNTWSTDNSANQLTFYDSNRTNSGFASEPTLGNIQSGDVDWSIYDNSNSKDVVNYADQIVKYIKLQNSIGGDWVNFDGYVDNLVISLNNGKTFIFDMEDDSQAPELVKSAKATDKTSIADNTFTIDDQAADNESLTISYDGTKYAPGDTLIVTTDDGKAFTKILTADDLKAGTDTVDITSYFNDLKDVEKDVTFTAAVKDAEGNEVMDALPTYSVAVDLKAPTLKAVANDQGGMITASEPLYYELNGALSPLTSISLDSANVDDAAMINTLFQYNDGSKNATTIINTVDFNAETNTWTFTTKSDATLNTGDTLTYNDKALFDKNGNKLSTSIKATFDSVSNSWAFDIQKNLCK